MATFTVPFWKALELDPSIETDVLAKYPLFDEDHREVLNQKIRDEYWNQEIGQETVSMFKLTLKRELNKIMPLYNQYYESEKHRIADPFLTTDIKTEGSVTSSTEAEGESSTDSATDAKARAVSSETPQTMLSGHGDYATGAQDNVSNTTATGAATEKSTSLQDQIQDSRTYGFSGNKPGLLLALRETFINIDDQILTDLAGCFMLIWSNGDEFTPRGGYDY